MVRAVHPLQVAWLPNGKGDPCGVSGQLVDGGGDECSDEDTGVLQEGGEEEGG
jgi:hypothetical protein